MGDKPSRLASIYGVVSVADSIAIGTTDRLAGIDPHHVRTQHEGQNQEDYDRL